MKLKSKDDQSTREDLAPPRWDGTRSCRQDLDIRSKQACDLILRTGHNGPALPDGIVRHGAGLYVWHEILPSSLRNGVYIR